MNTTYTTENKIEIENKSGVYLLFICLSKDMPLKIGSIGEIMFHKGLYIYVGSARGRGGLDKRLRRHILSIKKIFWHIDYLLKTDFSKIVLIGFYYTKEKEECYMRNLLIMFLSEYEYEQIPRFGSSDCKCKSHLFLVNNSLNFEKLKNYFVDNKIELLFLKLP